MHGSNRHPRAFSGCGRLTPLPPIFYQAASIRHRHIQPFGELVNVPRTLSDFPSLKDEDVQAAIAFAAASTEQDPPVRAGVMKHFASPQ